VIPGRARGEQIFSQLSENGKVPRRDDSASADLKVCARGEATRKAAACAAAVKVV
jgi:hypothetical protein